VHDVPAFLRRALREEGRDLGVAVIRLGAMGDILRTLPPVRLLRRALPRARLVWVVEEHWSVLLRDHPDLDSLVALPRKSWEKLLASPAGWARLPTAAREARRRLRSIGAGLALDFHGNLKSGIVCRLTSAPVRVGYSGHQQKEGNHWFTTHHVTSGARRTPRMERNLDLVRWLGIGDGPLPDGGLPMVRRGESEARSLRRAAGVAPGGYGVLSPGASQSQVYKKPPVALLAAACRALAARGLVALVVWGPGEEEDARRVVEAAGSGAVLSPPTSLPALSALLHDATLFVGGDSGPLHMACAVGCPVIGIYGPTDPQVNQPWGVPCRVLYPAQRLYTGVKRIDRESGSFEGLEPEEVEQAVGALLDEAR
jgi:ADP-heptose:LPS heptosyltransferase